MPSDNLEAFRLDLKKFAATVQADLLVVLKKTAADVFRGVVEKTPVDMGSARASWMITVDAPGPDVVVELKETGADGKAVAMQQLSKLNAVTPFSVINISNNLPYITKLEYGGYPDGPKTTGGFSSQAPQGMVAVTLNEVRTAMSNQVK